MTVLSVIGRISLAQPATPDVSGIEERLFKGEAVAIGVTVDKAEHLLPRYIQR